MGLENPLHLAIVLMVVLLVFGAKRLPEMGRGLGDGMRGFREAISGSTHVSSAELATAAQEAPTPEAQPSPGITTP